MHFFFETVKMTLLKKMNSIRHAKPSGTQLQKKGGLKPTPKKANT
jgi:hypothetical protein